MMKCKEARSTELQLFRAKGVELRTSETITSKTAVYAKWQSVISNINIYFCTANVDVLACYHGKAVLPGTDVLSW